MNLNNTTVNHLLGAILATLAAVLWGGAIVLSKFSLQAFSSKQTFFIQLLSSSVAIGLYLLFSNFKFLRFKKLIMISSLGILEPGLAYFLSLAGLAFIPASTAAIVQTTEAMMIIFLSSFFLKEKINYKIYLLTLLALSGVLMATGSISNSHSVGIIGIMLVAAGTLAAAFYVTLSSKVVKEINPIYALGLQNFLALLAFSPFLVKTAALLNKHDLFSVSMLITCVTGIMQYFLAFWFYLMAMQKLKASIAALFLNLIPVVAILGGTLLLAEKLTFIQMLGASLVILVAVIITLQED